MTVGELIKTLRKMPKDAQVIYTYHSDYTVLDEKDVELWMDEDQKVIADDGGIRFTEYKPHWFPDNLNPNFATVCHFPGC